MDDYPSCSGGKCVAGIGYGKGGVEIPDARVPEAGHYTLEIDFAYPYYGQNHDYFTQMTLFVSVNGGQRQRVDIPYAIRKRYTTGAVSVDVELKQGGNAILLDNPVSQEEEVRLSYVKLSNALARSGRQMMSSTSGAPRPWLWADPMAHLWRTSADINDQWAASVLLTVDRQVETLRHAGPGFWADPGMLEIGNRPRPARGGKPRVPMMPTEQRSQFSLWAIMNAPLFLSTDLRHADEETKTVLLDREVIAVNQDPLGVAGRRIRNEGAVQVFAKRLKDGEAVAFPNRGDAVTTVRVTSAEPGLDQPDPTDLEVRDLWPAGSSRATNGAIEAHAEPHAVKLLRVRANAAPPGR